MCVDKLNYLGRMRLFILEQTALNMDRNKFLCFSWKGKLLLAMKFIIGFITMILLATDYNHLL